MLDVLERLLRHRLGSIGLLIVSTAMLVVVVGPWLAPYDPTQFHPRARLQGPSMTFLLGTDQFGRDMLSRVLAGARSTILFGLAATAAGTFAGTLVGLATGYRGGWMDEIVMRIVDAKMAIPNLLFTLLVLTVLGPSATNAFIAVAVAFTPSMVRIARSAALSERSRDYVLAARARGEARSYIVFREMLPNVLAPVIVEASIRVAFAIMLGATLSYLGLGVQPPAPDWGLMVAEARAFLHVAPTLVLWPSVGIALVAVGFNLLGDGLRDALNPKLAEPS